MKPSDFRDYKIEDFIQDRYFSNWVKTPTHASGEFWNAFLSAYPKQKNELEKAKAFLLQFEEEYAKNALSEAELSLNLDQLLTKSKTKENHKRMRMYSLMPVYRYVAVASILLLVGSLCWFFFFDNAPVRYATDFGEQLKVDLPDGSLVHLNANSSLTLSPDWSDTATRRVKLEGEAYFKVEKIPATNAKFEVVTEQTVIQVLGTVFNVDTRENKTSVFLEEGKIRLVEMNKEKTAVNMEVGEVAHIYKNGNYEVAQKTSNNPSEYTSWKDGILTLNEMPLTEVLKELKAIYGISFLIENKMLENRKITFVMPIKKQEETLDILKKILQIQIEQNDGVYILK